jgi:UDP-glucose 4-epimerase
MLIYSGELHDKHLVVAVFGIGLIGSSISKYIEQNQKLEKSYFPFDWQDLSRLKVDLNLIRNFIYSQINKYEKNLEVSFVWAAGKAGFGALEKETSQELSCFRAVLSFVNELENKKEIKKTYFHHLSSAGGLFEGMLGITEDTKPEPKRPYGYLKYEQELELMALPFDIVKFVYRPTSVYGFSGASGRMGLIQTLLLNGIRNKESFIYGGLSTLRDYVFSEDVGFYVYNKVFNHNEKLGGCFILGSGKPYSIYEIKNVIERVVGRRLYLRYYNPLGSNNDADITINDAALPIDWHSVGIEYGVNSIKERMIAGAAF